jgi:hypothetical protein
VACCNFSALTSRKHQTFKSRCLSYAGNFLVTYHLVSAANPSNEPPLFLWVRRILCLSFPFTASFSISHPFIASCKHRCLVNRPSQHFLLAKSYLHGHYCPTWQTPLLQQLFIVFEGCCILLFPQFQNPYQHLSDKLSC